MAASATNLRFWAYDGKRVLARGQFFRLGTPAAYVEITTDSEPFTESLRHPTHKHAVRYLIDYLHRNSHIRALRDIDRVVHRIPHGGTAFRATVLLTRDATKRIAAAEHLSPDMPAALATLRCAMNALGGQHIGVFDTACTASLPPEAAQYALPKLITERFGLRRYGFAGILHQGTLEAGLRVTGSKRPRRAVTVVIDDAVSVVGYVDGAARETTSGFTLAEGLPGLHRSGSLDPRIPLYLATHLRATAPQIDALFTTHSGIANLAGKKTYDELLSGAQSGDEKCVDALMLLSYRIAQAIAGMTASLGGIDLIVFSGGGASWAVREEVCRRLSHFGVRLGKSRKPLGVVSAPRSRVLVVGVNVQEEDVLFAEAQRCVKTKA